MDKVKTFLNDFTSRHPILMVIIVFSLVGVLLWWFNQPVEVIYDRDSAPYNIDDDPEGGYFPRP